MKHASLFSGIGGFEVAAEAVGWENLFNCEIDPFCKQVLKYHYPDAQQFSDIRNTDFTPWMGTVDVLSGGFPCQPFSQAGKRRGTDDDRYLWPEMLRAISEIRPRWVVGENVYGIVNWNAGMVFDTVCADLENKGYQVQPYVLPACGVNAPHQRYRTFFVAYGNNNQCTSGSSFDERGRSSTVANGGGRTSSYTQRDLDFSEERRSATATSGVQAEHWTEDRTAGQPCGANQFHVTRSLDDGYGWITNDSYDNAAMRKSRGYEGAARREGLPERDEVQQSDQSDRVRGIVGDTDGCLDGTFGKIQERTKPDSDRVCKNAPNPYCGRGNEVRQNLQPGQSNGVWAFGDGLEQNAAHTNDQLQKRRDGQGAQGWFEPQFGIESSGGSGMWDNFPTQSPLCGRNDELSDLLDIDAVFAGVSRNKRAKAFNRWRTEAIKAYGNAVVPQLIIQLFRTIALYEQLYGCRA